MFFFQLATGRIQNAVYKKLIAPFKNDLPISINDGFRRVCGDDNYAYVGPNILHTKFFFAAPLSVGSTSWKFLQGAIGFYNLQ